MIIKSQKQIIRSNNLPPPRIISRLKIHPSLTQDNNQSNILNLFVRKSSQSKFVDQYKKRRKSQDDTTWRSKIQLKPIISRSTDKNLTQNDSSLLASNRSDRKLLNLKCKSNQRKQMNLKNLLSFDQSRQQVLKIKQINNQTNSANNMNKQTNQLNNENMQMDLDIEQQFYQQVKILQAFKELNRMTN